MNERSLFLDALERPSDQRAAFLDDACGGDAELRHGVDALLHAHESSGVFLDGADPTRTSEGNARPASSADDFLAYLQPCDVSGSLGRLKHYVIQKVLGRGGFGVVFKAFDESLHRVVAIKMMAPALAATSPPRKRFLREARAVAAIKHENVVAVFAVEEEPIPYLVMEYVAGPTLQEHLDQTGPLDPADVVRFSRQVALGLAAAHETGLIHRDIKPGNILIEQGVEPKAKITDFGLARAADDARLTQSGAICGTPMYMSPEQAAGTPVDARSDLFSLGSVMYVMASGRPPFRADSTLAVMRRVADDVPRPINEIVSGVPGWLCGIVERLHEKDPDNRFASARDVVAALDRRETVRPARPRRASSNRWIIAVVAVVLLVPLVGVAVVGAAMLFLWTSVDTVRNDPLPEAAQLVQSGDAGPERRLAAEDPDRVAAAHVLALGATIQVDLVDHPLQRGDTLPARPFRLTHVTADGTTTLGDAGLANFAGTRHLKVLRLTGIKPTAAGLMHLAGNRDLEELSLSGDSIDDAALAHFQGCRQLRDLRVRSKNVTNAGIAPFKDCEHLTRLDLAETAVTDDGLAAFKDHKGLTLLVLGDTAVSDAGVAHFAGCTDLETLELFGSRVSDEGLANFKGCTKLKRLDLAGCSRVTPAGWKQVAGLKGVQTLNALATTLGDDDLKLFVGTALRHLNVGETHITDAGMAHLKDCKGLQTLGIQGTDVTSAGLNELKGLTGMRFLHVEDTAIDDGSIDTLTSFRTMAILSIEGTRITEAGEKRLRTALPTCRIDSDRTKK